MTPPTFSKPKEKPPTVATWRTNKKRNYISCHHVKVREGRPARESTREEPSDLMQSIDQMKTDWIVCKQDAAEVARIVKGGRT